MPLGLGLGLGLQKPTLPPPVSSWPTIADIPQGAVVLDTDGVVKKCVYVFNNAGTDFANFGRRPHILALLDPTKPSTVCAVSKTLSDAGAGTGYIWGLADSGSVIQNGVYSPYPGALVGYGGAVGGSGLFTSPNIVVKPIFSKVSLFTDGSSFAKITDGATIGSVNKGVLTSTTNFFVGGRTDGATANFEGQIAYVAFYDGYNADGSCTGLRLVDKIDFNKWDGSASGLSDMGYSYSVTKASPFTELVKALVPVSML